ncbi:TRAP-type mannitol/chloroaromatic compound transport system, small permease component [Modicisalibacter ilicicola DSM 19980]|uniref:TRAP transporter small permease protein n=1 Tax=Modicisalibacter ilicicola DSM 19980 TaxID=1121942 RepID=A0A1M5F0L7_9GAMM|nr:TRAP transporter small permease subunit [Halomonas ilicicola]SHF85039.1 TRAP-type mannitol/chloroaromatic compound transport system, small permease component [Halomonas ilicicola DSM 19980]
MAQDSSRALTPGRIAILGYIRLMDALSSAVAVIAGSLLLAGVLAVCHMIFMRYVLGQSTIWQTEFAIYSVTGAMLLGAPYVLMNGGHVAVTVLPDALGGWIRKAMYLLSALVGLAFCVALAYSGWHYFLEAYHLGWTTGTVWNPPLWPALLPLAIGISLLSLQYVAEIFRRES